MTHTADCLPASTARPATRWFRGSRIWIALPLIAALAGLVALERGGTGGFLAGLNLETGSIPGEDWHGNVRRSTPAR
ncbi:hypothetical protein [Sedimentitalea todarodis]|uniref:Uncharacterized protein n=1 Tax=Sedimentitalea todarodis TaxID=1631240 RepID=A0ABU3V8R3_9RHOB|nr:hypothetical protein [Sedimentitalea todarodis]MDU9002540.1 hypothetical protein [Sedimentitalea todarodis]